MKLKLQELVVSVVMLFLSLLLGHLIGSYVIGAEQVTQNTIETFVGLGFLNVLFFVLIVIKYIIEIARDINRS